MLDVTKTFNIDDSVKNIDFSKCCTTESLLLTKLWNGDSDIMGLLLQRVSNRVKRIIFWKHFIRLQMFIVCSRSDTNLISVICVLSGSGSDGKVQT